MKLLPARNPDKKYFEKLNEASYRDVVILQFGKWDPKLQRPYFDKKWEEAAFQKILIDNTVVGGLWVQEFDTYHQLREIQIHPDFQNQGIGTQVINNEILRAKEIGKALKLKVLLKNRAFNLYKKLGFSVTGKDDAQYHMIHSGTSI